MTAPDPSQNHHSTHGLTQDEVRMTYLNMLVDAARYLHNHAEAFTFQQVTTPHLPPALAYAAQPQIMDWLYGVINNLRYKHNQIEQQQRILSTDFLGCQTLGALHHLIAVDIVREIPVIPPSSEINDMEDTATFALADISQQMAEANQAYLQAWSEDGMPLKNQMIIRNELQDRLAENYQNLLSELYSVLSIGTPNLFCPQTPSLDVPALRKAQQQVAYLFDTPPTSPVIAFHSFNVMGRAMLAAIDMACVPATKSMYPHQLAGRMMSELGYGFQHWPIEDNAVAAPVGTITASVFNELALVATGLKLALQQHGVQYTLHRGAGCKQVPDNHWSKTYQDLSHTLTTTSNLLFAQRDKSSGQYLMGQPSPGSFQVQFMPLSCN
jgi:hypothetical protein